MYSNNFGLEKQDTILGFSMATNYNHLYTVSQKRPTFDLL